MIKHWPGDGAGEADRESRRENGKKTFYPLSLQYAPYTATTGRNVSISRNIDSAGTKENRSYNGQTSNLYNSYDIIAGNFEPKGLLPVQMPKNMDAVERQLEDIGRDMDCYVDSVGNTYDFAYGLNYKGVIKDARVKKYSK